MKIKVAVLFGGKSVEHEVSIISAIQAMNSMNVEKYDVIPVYITKSGGEFYTGELLRNVKNFKDIPSLLRASRRVSFARVDDRVYLYDSPAKGLSHKPVAEIDVAFPIVHGTNVEDGTVAGYLRFLGLPFVGCGVLASALGMDKYASKIILKESGVPVLDCLLLDHADKNDLISAADRCEAKFGYPVIVKPVNLGSSVGITKAKDRDALISALELAFTFSEHVIAERAITRLREINCAVLGDSKDAVASLCEEPLNAGDILSYEDKYIDGAKGGSKSSGMASLKRKIPADISEELCERIQNEAVRAFKILGCSGVARIDFMLDLEGEGEGDLYLNELNTIPGSLAFYLFEPMGIKYPELCDRLISLALRTAREDEEMTYSFDTNILSLGGKFGSKK